MTRASAYRFAAFFTAFVGAAVAWSVSVQNHAAAGNPHANVVSVGNAVTEIVYALDQGHRLVARDSTSNFPAAARALPSVGYMRALSAEGVLSMRPELILAIEGAGPPEVIDVLKSTGVAFVEVSEGFTAEAVAQKIRVVGEALDVPDAAEALATEVMGDVQLAGAAISGTPRRVMFLMSAKGGKLIAAGRNTAADAVITMAGGVNAVSGFDGYKTLEDEAATAAAPDLVLMMERMGEHDADAAELFALPSLSSTPAAATGALVKVDGAKLLGFGPRTAEAVQELNAVLYPR